MKKNGCLKKFLIHLDAEQGENLRLSFKVNFPSARYFLADADFWLKEYLNDHPSERGAPASPSNSFLMDFPNNSVFYNLHKSSHGFINDDREIIIKDFMDKFSDTMIDTFENENFDDDTIFSFATYALSGILFAYYCEHPNAALLKNIFSPISDRGSLKANHNFNDLSRENRAAMIEIMEDVFRPEFSEEESMKSLSGWRLFCVNSFKNLSLKMDSESAADILRNISERILFQLGIRNESKARLLSLIIDGVNNFKLSVYVQ